MNYFGDNFDDVNLMTYFDDECCDDGCIHFWNEINIVLLENKNEHNNIEDIENENVIGVITYSTNDYEPHLVYMDGEFKFYYVFEQSSNTCTNPIDMKNTGISEYPCEKCLEQILIDELNECLKQE